MIRGERFEVDLGSEDDRDIALSGAFVNDVLERKPATSTPPSAPTLKTKTGFPEHKKRIQNSRFKTKILKQNVSDATAASTVPPLSTLTSKEKPALEPDADGKRKTWEEEEKERIDAENRQKLAQMSPAEIEESTLR